MFYSQHTLADFEEKCPILRVNALVRRKWLPSPFWLLPTVRNARELSERTNRTAIKHNNRKSPLNQWFSELRQLKRSFDFECIAPAVNAVYNGQTVFGEEIIGKLPDLLGHSESHSTDVERSPFADTQYEISSKEMDIIRLVADGLNNKEIASRLFLSEGTVRNYISSILDKLCLRDRTQLACFFYKNLKH